MSRDAVTTSPRFVTNGKQREQSGCIVTFENAGGKTFVVHRVGAPTLALREACRIASLLDPSFRIVSYSSPGTVFTDLTGRGIVAGRTTPPCIEAMVATTAGVRNMLHPRILAQADAKIDESKQRAARSRWAT